MGMPISEDNYRIENAYVPPIDSTRVAAAAWDLGVEDRETSVLAKMTAKSELSKIGPKLSPEKINAQFPGMGADREMTAQEAQFTYDLKEERREKEAILASASGFWQGTALPFVAGSASSMMDPVGFAIGAFTGWGLGKVATKAVSKSAIKSGAIKLSTLEMNVFNKSVSGTALSAVEKKIMGEITSKGALTGAKKFALDVVDNAIGNSVTEALVWKDRKDSFEEYTTKDFLQNAIGGSVLMTGMIHGGSKILKSAAKAGDKYLSNTQQVVDTLIDNGKSLEAVDDMLKIMDNAITHTDESNIIIKESFGDKVEAGETLVDTAKNIREAYGEGKITEAEVDAYRSRVEESSVVDSRAVDFIDPEYTFNYNDAELDQFNSKVMDNISDVNYSKEVAETSDSLSGYDPERVSSDLESEVDLIFNTKETNADGVELDTPLDPEVEAIKTKMNDDIEVTKIQEAYAKCRVI